MLDDAAMPTFKMRLCSAAGDERPENFRRQRALNNLHYIFHCSVLIPKYSCSGHGAPVILYKQRSLLALCAAGRVAAVQFARHNNQALVHPPSIS